MTFILKAWRVAGRVLLAFLPCLAASSRLFAQSGPDNDPMGLAGRPFGSFAPDSIDLFNGQLTIPIAIGPSYPVGPSLRFQAVLTYNSKIWELGHPARQNPDFTYTPITGNPALGAGWRFSLGAVKLCSGTSTYCFVGPDGSQHIFDEPDAARGTGFYKSSDGSRLSLKNNAANGFEMWDEAGNHHVFDWHVTGYDDSPANFTHDFGRGRDGWYLTKLEDPFGNNFTVSYHTNSSSESNSPCWTYQGTPDPTGAMQCPSYTAAPNTWIPSTITVPKGSGGMQNISIGLDSSNMISQFQFPVAGSATATWTLAYGSLAYSNQSSGTINLRTIASVAFPSGLGGSPQYSFDYFSSTACNSMGLVKHVGLPAGATIDYRYRQYNVYHTRIARFAPGCRFIPPPSGQAVVWSGLEVCAPLLGLGRGPFLPGEVGGCIDTNPDVYLDTITMGVGERTLTVSGAPAVTDYFQYSFPYGEYGTGPAPNNCDLLGRCGAESLTIVVSPEVDLNGQPAGSGRRVSRAVLFTDASGTAGGTEGAPIEERLFDHDVSVQTAIAQPVCGAPSEQSFCPDKAVRVTQRTFEYGDDVNSNAERRLRYEVVYYQATNSADVCPTCTYHSVSFSNSPGRSWDASDGTGNGRHYNLVTHTGSLGNDTRTITTAWMPQINSSTYLPDLFTERVNAAGSSTKNQLFEFEASTGFARGTLVWDGANQRVWLNCRFRDGQGNVGQAFTRTFTSGSAPAHNYCSANYPSMPSVGLDQDSFGQNFSYQNSELLSASWLAGTTPLGWRQLTLTRDTSTGWITSAEGSAGLLTGYAYDSIGRITDVTPPGEAPLSVVYPSLTQTIARRDGGIGLTTDGESDFDGLGRLIRQRRLMPAGQYSKRFIKYDAWGTPYFVSEWVSDSAPEDMTVDIPTTCSFSGSSFSTKRPSAAPGVYLLCFDPFGRSQQVIGPKFSSLVTTDRTSGSTYYSNTREAVTIACLNGILSTTGSCSGGGVNATTTALRDAFGRVTSLTEPSADVTQYAYDVNGNLTCVKQSGAQDMSNCTSNPGGQYRSFSFDSFGLLRQQVTPEKGPVTYDSFGSLGNLRQATEPGSLITLRCYDSAGRVTSFRSNENGQTPACGNPGAGRVYLGFTYDQNPSSSNYSLGRLTQRQGFNPGVTQTPTVTDVFTYGGIGGRLSQRTTAVSGGDGLSTTQGWLYNSLGLPAHYYHPRMAGALPLVVSTVYDAGLPMSEHVNGIPMVKSVRYAASGAIASYSTGLGVGTDIVTDIALEPSGIPRPSEISARPESTFFKLFDTGTYLYDGAGNIMAMGPDTFSYDNRSRLMSATLSGLGTQGFTYDLYGNLLSKGSTTYSVSASTNRLNTATYDARGNLTINGPEIFGYDGLSRMISNQNGTSWGYVYDAGSERAVKIPPGSGAWTYTLRDGATRLAAESSGTVPSRDNVFLGNLLVASYANAAVLGNGMVWTFYSSDHLGSPRLVTDVNGGVVEARRYWPYGEEATFAGAFQRIRFATMERDTEGNRYFDHARSHDFSLGRFLTPDPIPGSLFSPQSWNRYTYALGNPLRFVDPFGLCLFSEGEPCKSGDGGGGSEDGGDSGSQDGGEPTYCCFSGDTTVTGDIPPDSEPPPPDEGWSWWQYNSLPTVSNGVIPSGPGTAGGLAKPQQSFGQCVQHGTDYFSLQQIVQRASGGSLGNSALAQAFLGSDVSDWITLANPSASLSDKLNVGGNQVGAHLVDWAIDEQARAVPNYTVTVIQSEAYAIATPTSVSMFGSSSGITATLPFGSGAMAFAKGLSHFNAAKGAYDVSVGLFSAVICGIGR